MSSNPINIEFKNLKKLCYFVVSCVLVILFFVGTSLWNIHMMPDIVHHPTILSCVNVGELSNWQNMTFIREDGTLDKVNLYRENGTNCSDILQNHIIELDMYHKWYSEKDVIVKIKVNNNVLSKSCFPANNNILGDKFNVTECIASSGENEKIDPIVKCYTAPLCSNN